MQKVLPEQEIKERAASIAVLVATTHTDQRHVLYLEVARLLARQSQHFTAQLFTNIAVYDRGGIVK